MTWISEKKLTWYESVCLNVLKTGHVPRHVAFIMDGNRRFAKRNNMEKAEGHARGFTKLSETLKWCRDLGVTEVTVYAFSIENFRRPQEEIDGIMNLARDKFRLLLQEKDKLSEHGVCIRFIGDLSLLPEDIQRLIAEVMLMTREHSSARINIAFSYTAREEISRAVRDMASGVECAQLRPGDVSERLVERCLYTRDSPRPDLLVRTSGEVRLSDFLLWQTTHTCIYFTKVLWPDFSIWHLFAAVFCYQRNYEEIQTARLDRATRRLQHAIESADDSGCESADSAASSTVDSDSARPDSGPARPSSDSAADEPDAELDSARVEAFVRWLDARRWGRLEALVGGASLSTCDASLSTCGASPSAGDASLSTCDASLPAGGASPSDGDASLSTGDASLSTGNASPSAGDASLSIGDASLSTGNASPSAGDASLSTGNASPSAGDASLSAGGASLSTCDASLPAGGASPSDGDGASLSADGSSVSAGEAS